VFKRLLVSHLDLALHITEDQTVASQIAMFDNSKYTADRYSMSYQLFAEWILSSLDMYKVSVMRQCV
jgi:hypothetical protein